MLELIQKIKDHVEAGIILEHMELFSDAEVMAKERLIDLDKPVVMKCPTCGLQRTFSDARQKCYCAMCESKKEKKYTLWAYKQGE